MTFRQRLAQSENTCGYNSHESRKFIHEILAELEVRIEKIEKEVSLILELLHPKLTVTLTVKSQKGAIMQTNYAGLPGSDTLTFTCTRQDGVDVTKNYSFVVTSDNPAVVQPGAPTVNTCGLTNAVGTCNLTISGTSSAGDPPVSVTLAATIATPETVTLVVSASTGKVS